MRLPWGRVSSLWSCAFVVVQAAAAAAAAGGAGAVGGAVTDPSGLPIPKAVVTVSNRLTGLRASSTTGQDGSFRIGNLPPNPYHIEVAADGFKPVRQEISIRTSVPLNLKFSLALAGVETSLTVEGAAPLVENVPYAHQDIDRAAYGTLPVSTPGSGLSDVITLASPGVVADSNGFFHPLGDHAQTTFSIDGQAISDQQSKQFSAELPLNAIQSMELITGAANAEFGDKSSLVVNAVTRSGLGSQPHGSILAQYGSFGTAGEESTFAVGSAKVGNFVSANVLRSGRFLDTPEFRPYHAAGNNYTLFDRFDYQTGGANAYHLNLFQARNWFQIPDTFNQLWSGQDQRQKTVSFNLAPSFQHTFNARTLLGVNAYWRQDQVEYDPSRNPLADLPATISQDRRLANWGGHADLSYVQGAHNLKIGAQLSQTRLRESFGLGITDPSFDFVSQPGLAPYNLLNGGSLFLFDGRAKINQYAVYAQDAITLGNLTVNAGFRVDRYNGLTAATGVQPRLGLSYKLKPTGTVLRVAYSRTFETPYNENLILSSATGSGGLATNVFGASSSQPIQPGRRNQYNTGLQQLFGKWLMVDADYFWKYTHNAFDFGALFNTSIAFPISWRESKLDGVSIRLGTPELHGFQATTTMGHTRARYFGPSNGGLVFNSPLDSSVFRIDHDQAFEQTTHLRYQRPHNGPWMAFTWRYDSGMVAGAVESLGDALALTAAGQSAIGFYCGAQSASLSSPITSCSSPNFGATRLRIPAPGTADADHNPPRIAPRHLLDVAAGTDNLFHAEHFRTTLKFMVTNLTDRVALYNFQSTFSGTHFVSPRAYTAQIGLVF
jgi:hypothetical protein